ncbi:MAG: hypothetical protein ACPG32_16205, partial [Akkermansiaceae bacterium]
MKTTTEKLSEQPANVGCVHPIVRRWKLLNCGEKSALIAVSPLVLIFGIVVSAFAGIALAIYYVEKFLTGKEP